MKVNSALRVLSLIVLFGVSSLSAHAFDSWKDKEFSGETVYYSGVDYELLLGKRGVGLGYPSPYANTLFEEPVTLKIDGNPPKQFQVKQLAATTLLIIGDDALRLQIANAKRVEATFKRCPLSSICAFSSSGFNKPIVWEFEQPLSEQFKDYKQKTH